MKTSRVLIKGVILWYNLFHLLLKAYFYSSCEFSPYARSFLHMSVLYIKLSVCLTMTEYNGLHMVGCIFLLHSNLDVLVNVCLWLRFQMPVGGLFSGPGCMCSFRIEWKQKVGGLRETTQNNLCKKISIAPVLLCKSDSMKIACLNFFREKSGCFECISLPIWGRQCSGKLVRGLWIGNQGWIL